MKYKLGDVVKATNKDYEPKEFYGKVVLIDNNSDLYPYLIQSLDKNINWCFSEKDLSPAPKNWDTLTEGDVLVDKVGGRRMVLGVLGDVVHLSMYNDFDVFGGSYIKKELQKAGWKIENTEQDIIEKDGKKYEVKIIREIK